MRSPLALLQLLPALPASLPHGTGMLDPMLPCTPACLTQAPENTHIKLLQAMAGRSDGRPEKGNKGTEPSQDMCFPWHTRRPSGWGERAEEGIRPSVLPTNSSVRSSSCTCTGSQDLGLISVKRSPQPVVQLAEAACSPQLQGLDV